MNETPPNESPVKELIGLILVVIGVLWMAASGLCSLGFIVLTFPQAADPREFLGIMPMVAIVGGFSIGLGFVFYVVGRALRPKKT
jgi:hypothetical protein